MSKLIFRAPFHRYSNIQAFVQQFATLCPALCMPSVIQNAREFFRRSEDERTRVSLPWLSLFLMIIALGKVCDLDTVAVSVASRKRQTSDAEGSLDMEDTQSGVLSVPPAEFTKRAQERQGAIVLAHSSGPSTGTQSEHIFPIEADLYRKPTATPSPPPINPFPPWLNFFPSPVVSATYQSLRLCSFLSAPTLQTIHAQLLIGGCYDSVPRHFAAFELMDFVILHVQVAI